VTKQVRINLRIISDRFDLKSGGYMVSLQEPPGSGDVIPPDCCCITFVNQQF